jgi:hypothetical protein
MSDASQPPPSGSHPPVRRTRRRRTSASGFASQLAAAMPRPWVSYALLGINAIVFLLMIATGVSAIDPTTPELLAWGADFGPWTVGGEWWRLVSNAFVHIGVLHLLLNMWCLQGVGPLAERLLGHGVFAVVYVFSGILGSLVSIAWNPTWVSDRRFRRRLRHLRRAVRLFAEAASHLPDRRVRADPQQCAGVRALQHPLRAANLEHRSCRPRRRAECGAPGNLAPVIDFSVL